MSDPIFGEVISSYSRAQAIEDGVLVDLSAVAPEVCRQHFKTPVACTAEVWSTIDKAVKNKRWMNDLNGVIHDLLWMSRCYARPGHASHLFPVIIRGAGRKSKFTFKAVCGPGDQGEPVITIMLPQED
jgi:hypothetical protein